MTTIFSLILSLVLTLLCIAVPWWAKPVKTWQICIVFGISLALWLAGAIFSLGWYPWTNIVVFLVGVGAGMLLARVISAKFWPFLIFLLVMSILDVMQIILSGHPSALAGKGTSIPAGEFYANFLLQLPWGTYRLGPVDLLILAACAVYWRRQSGQFLTAFAGMAIGIIIGYAVLFVEPSILLPLIPFLTFGWLCSVGIHRYRKQSTHPKLPAQDEVIS